MAETKELQSEKERPKDVTVTTAKTAVGPTVAPAQEAPRPKEKREDPPEVNAAKQAETLTKLHEEHLKKEEKSKEQSTKMPLADGTTVETDPNKKVQTQANNFLGQREHRNLPGIDDGAIPGSRSGNPLHVVAEHLIGDKIHDVHKNGSMKLKVLNKDKTRASHIYDHKEEGEDTHKIKIQLSLPGINPKVSQKELSIKVGNNKPAFMFIPPDVSTVSYLVHRGEPIHVELVHIDQKGERTAPYIGQYPSSQAVPIGIEVMGDVLTKEIKTNE